MQRSVTWPCDVTRPSSRTRRVTLLRASAVLQGRRYSDETRVSVLSDVRTISNEGTPARPRSPYTTPNQSKTNLMVSDSMYFFLSSMGHRPCWINLPFMLNVFIYCISAFDRNQSLWVNHSIAVFGWSRCSPSLDRLDTSVYMHVVFVSCIILHPRLVYAWTKAEYYTTCPLPFPFYHNHHSSGRGWFSSQGQRFKNSIINIKICLMLLSITTTYHSSVPSILIFLHLISIATFLWKKVFFKRPILTDEIKFKHYLK